MADSFSQKVRDEAARRSLHKCCQKPFLMAMLTGAKYFRRYGRVVWRLAHGATVRTLIGLLKELALPHTWHQEANKEGRRQFYVVELPELPQSYYRLPPFNGSCCRRSWITGLYLVCGAVADPHKDYYLAWNSASWDCAYLLLNCLSDEGLEPSLVEREHGQLVCLKRAEDVGVALSLLGATLARLEFEDIRAVRETSNDLHRLVNAETANIKRMADTAARQIKKLQILQNNYILGGLSDSLTEVLRLRLENPDLSYRELGEIMTPPLTRASVGKKLAKLEKIADELVVQAADSQESADYFSASE
ncbi:MAG: DNA-binding protein WhiA [bacterium]|nr:DNA-binding protein WhiA [bacterium]